MSTDGKLVFLCVLTCPQQTALGVFVSTPENLASQFNIPAKAFREGFREALREGLLKYSEKDALIWLPNFLRYNPPQSPNCVRAWPHVWADIPECAMQVEIWQHLKAFGEGLREAFSKAFREAFAEVWGHPWLNQEQEQEQEQEEDSATIVAGSAQSANPPADDSPLKPKELVDFVLDAWQGFADENGWHKLRDGDSKQRQKIRAKLQTRLAEKWWREHWEDGLVAATEVPFYKGDVIAKGWDKPFRMNLEAFVRPDFLGKLLEQHAEWQEAEARKREQQTEVSF